MIYNYIIKNALTNDTENRIIAKCVFCEMKKEFTVLG